MVTLVTSPFQKAPPRRQNHFLLAKSRQECHFSSEGKAMSELELIETALKRAARGRRWERAWRGGWQGILAGGLVLLLTLAAYKLFPIPKWSLAAAGAVAGALVLMGLIAGGWKKSSLLQTARWIDGKKHLQERLSSALEFSTSPTAGKWKELLVQDAARHANEVDPRSLSPIRFTRAGRWALLVLILSAGLGFLPEYRSKQFLRKQQNAANIRNTGKQLAEFTRRNLQRGFNG